MLSSGKILKVCENCNNEFIARRSQKGRFCSYRCTFAKVGKRGKGKNSPGWKGGRYKGTDGYIYIHTPEHQNAKPSGYFAEHRLVMETKLGRSLLREEVVHHLNHIPNDNRPENLMLIESNAKHSSYHRKLHPYARNEKGQYIGKSIKK